MSQEENKESQLKIIDEFTDKFLNKLLIIEENDGSTISSLNDNNTNDSTYNPVSDNESDDSDSTSNSSNVSSLSMSNIPDNIEKTIGTFFPSFKEKDYKLIKQKVNKLSNLIKEKKPNIEENLKKEIKKLIITILQLNNESNIIDAYEPLFTKNLIVSTDVDKSEYILDILDNSEKVIGISGVLNKDFIGKLKYLDEIIQLKEKTKDNVEIIIAEVGNTSIDQLKNLLESQNKAKEEKKNAQEANVPTSSTGGKRTFKRRRKTKINKKNKRKTNKSKQNKK